VQSETDRNKPVKAAFKGIPKDVIEEKKDDKTGVVYYEKSYSMEYFNKLRRDCKLERKEIT